MTHLSASHDHPPKAYTQIRLRLEPSPVFLRDPDEDIRENPQKPPQGDLDAVLHIPPHREHARLSSPFRDRRGPMRFGHSVLTRQPYQEQKQVAYTRRAERQANEVDLARLLNGHLAAGSSGLSRALGVGPGAPRQQNTHVVSPLRQDVPFWPTEARRMTAGGLPTDDLTAPRAVAQGCSIVVPHVHRRPSRYSRHVPLAEVQQGLAPYHQNRSPLTTDPSGFRIRTAAPHPMVCWVILSSTSFAPCLR